MTYCCDIISNNSFGVRDCTISFARYTLAYYTPIRNPNLIKDYVFNANYDC